MPEVSDAQYDLIVLGAGAAGMTAALVAAIEGARVLLLESTDCVGGTSARSSGTLWIPADTAAASAYLDALVGDKADKILRQAFLAAGPAMIAYLKEHAGFRFRPYAHHPDYRQDLPGAAQGGRAHEPPEFDARLLGAQFAQVAWPIRELMLFGGMMITRAEAAQLLQGLRSPAAAFLGARLVMRYLADRLRHPRGTRLVLGNALVARLFKCLLERKVDIWFRARTDRLLTREGRVAGAAVDLSGEKRSVSARCGVVLAGGGFPASAALREKHFRQPVARHTAAAESCLGQTLRLGEEAGGSLGPSGEDNAFWFPGSIAPRADGTTAVYPHIVLDRAKPGLVAVGKSGLRFTNEAASYHEFTRAMYRTGNVPAWLVCDRRFLWRYGLGMIRPLTLRLGRYMEAGYLHEGKTVAALADAIGVDAAGLAQTVRRHAEFARTGLDPDFGKGRNRYDVGNGDASNLPNPCLGPIERAPFYAVRVEPTPLGTSLGLRTNEHAQVCDGSGHAIAGLYAVGSDMHSPMGGEYPGAGAQLGPGMTFAYLAVLHALQHQGDRNEQTDGKRRAGPLPGEAHEEERRRADCRISGRGEDPLRVRHLRPRQRGPARSALRGARQGEADLAAP
jgi:3-oxosteroid 1-dehydrogenase